MDSSTAFKPFEADYAHAYGLYIVPRGKGKKRPLSINNSGIFVPNNPQTWHPLDVVTERLHELRERREMSERFRYVPGYVMRPEEVCFDFDPKTPEQHAEALLWIEAIKDARIERTVRGGWHVNFMYNSPALFPAKLVFPESGLTVDVKRGYYLVNGNPCGGSTLTIGEPYNDNPIAELTKRDHATLTAMMHVGGKETTTSSTSGFKSGVIASPQGKGQQVSAQAELDRIEIERPHLFAVLQQPPDEPSTAPGFAGVTGSDKLARIIAEVYEVTGSEQNTLDIVRGSPVGWFDNRSAGKRETQKTEIGYQKFLAKDVRRVIEKKQQHNAAQTAGVIMSLPNVVTLNPEKKKISTKPRRLSYTSFNGEPGINDTTTVIVENLLTAGVCYLYGASKSYKSFLAVGLCGAITKKTDYFNGRKIAGGNALYIAAEAPKTLNARRFAWAQEHNNGQPLPNWHTIESGLNFADPELFAELVELCDEITTETGEPLRLIVVDTFSRTFVGNENSTEDTMKFHNAVDVLAQRYSCAVVVVHHSGKDEARGMRGSSAMYAAADTVIICKRGNGLSIQLELDKTKVGADGEIITLPLKLVKLPDSFAAANQSSQQFTTILDPKREAQRRNEELTTLVLMDNDQPPQFSIDDIVTAANATTSQPSNTVIVLDVLRQHTAPNPDDNAKPPVTREALRELINDYMAEREYAPTSLNDPQSKALFNALAALIKRGVISTHQSGKNQAYFALKK